MWHDSQYNDWRIESWQSPSSNITHLMTNSFSHERRIHMWHDSQYNDCIESWIIHSYVTWLTIQKSRYPAARAPRRSSTMTDSLRHVWLIHMWHDSSLMSDIIHDSYATWLTIPTSHNPNLWAPRRSSIITDPLSFDLLVHMWHASQSIRDMTHNSSVTWQTVQMWHDSKFIYDLTHNTEESSSDRSGSPRPWIFFLPVIALG